MSPISSFVSPVIPSRAYGVILQGNYIGYMFIIIKVVSSVQYNMLSEQNRTTLLKYWSNYSVSSYM